MTTQFFLAFGLMYALIGLAMIANPSQIKKALIALFKNDGLLFLIGFLSLLFGVIILTLHREIGSPMEIIVTTIGALALVKGFIYLTFPHSLEKRVVTKFKNEKSIRAAGIFCVAIAALFIWKSIDCGCAG